MKFNKHQKILAAILISSFILSIGYSFYFKNKPTVDAKRYDAIASNLISGHGYRVDKNLGYDRDIAIYLVGPGYEFFLAGVYFIFGRSLSLIWFLNALMLVGSAYFAYSISRMALKEAWKPGIGLSAVALVGLSPDLILVNSMLLSEPFGIFLMMAGIFSFLKYLDKNNTFWLVVMSAITACAVLTRPVIILIAGVFAVAMFILRRRFDILVFLFVGLAIFTPWIMRNWNIYHSFIPTSLTAAVDIWWGNHEGVSGELDTFPELSKMMETTDPITVKNIAEQKAREFILNNPSEFLKLAVKRTSIYFSFIRPTGWWPYPGGMGYQFSWTRLITLAFSAGYSIIIFTLGIGGIAAYLKNRKKIKDHLRLDILFGAAVLMPLSIVFIFVESRYRYPIYPLMAIFGGYFAYSLYSERDYWKNKIFICTAVILSLNSVWDIARNIARIKERI